MMITSNNLKIRKFSTKINSIFRSFIPHIDLYVSEKKDSIFGDFSQDLDSYVYKPLLFLLFLSITSGYLLSDIFLGLGSDFFSNIIFINPVQNQIFFEKHFEIFFLKIIPILISFFFFLFFDTFNFNLKRYRNIYYFFKLKLYFDFVVNFFLLFFYKFSYIIFFKKLDKGFLEIFGPFGLIRYFYFLTSNLNKFNLSIFFNYVCLFSFFFAFSLIF